MVHQLIASPYPEGHVIVRPGSDGALRIGVARYAELRDAAPDAPVPGWLTQAARNGWGIDITGTQMGAAVLVRPPTEYGYARASYELNLGCNYDFFWTTECDTCPMTDGGLLSGLSRCFVDGWEPYPRLFQEHLVALVGVEETAKCGGLDPGLEQEQPREQPAD